MGTLTFTINGVFSVKYKLEEEEERKRRGKVDLDLKLQVKVAGCKGCTKSVSPGVFKDNPPKIADLRFKTRFL